MTTILLQGLKFSKTYVSIDFLDMTAILYKPLQQRLCYIPPNGFKLEFRGRGALIKIKVARVLSRSQNFEISEIENFVVYCSLVSYRRSFRAGLVVFLIGDLRNNRRPTLIMGWNKGCLRSSEKLLSKDLQNRNL